MTYIFTIAKALVPVSILAVQSLLGVVGITPEMTVEQALALLGMAFLVWLVPNKK